MELLAQFDDERVCLLPDHVLSDHPDDHVPGPERQRDGDLLRHVERGGALFIHRASSACRRASMVLMALTRAATMPIGSTAKWESSLSTSNLTTVSGITSRSCWAEKPISGWGGTLATPGGRSPASSGCFSDAALPVRVKRIGSSLSTSARPYALAVTSRFSRSSERTGKDVA